MSYSPLAGKGTINPNPEMDLADGFLIEDAYDVSIEFDNVLSKRTVKELGGRILHTKAKWQLSWADLHMYQNNTLCLCPEPEEKLMFSDGFSLSKYFYDILIPYFYFQSYLARFGNGPWQSTSHNEVGMLESYRKQRFTTRSVQDVFSIYQEYFSAALMKHLLAGKRINQDILCLCGSNKKFKTCHMLAFEGLLTLCADYRSLSATRP